MTSKHGERNGSPCTTDEPDIVDPIPDVARRWKWSVDSIYAGDAARPLRYEVVLTFGQSQDDVPAQISGATPDDKALVHISCS
jgi:hypothetical protein